MSDRLAVMDKGRVVQLGSPRDVYENPSNAYVADFLGVANLLEVESLGNARVRCGESVLACGAGDAPVGPAKIVVRPERVRVEPVGVGGENRINGMVDRLVYLGATTQITIRLPHGAIVHALVTNADGAVELVSGSPVTLDLPTEAVRLLPIEDGVIGPTDDEQTELRLAEA